MALNVATLVARVLADTSQFQRGMDTVEGRLATSGQAMMRAGGVMTRGITIPLVAAAAASVHFGVDFQRQMEFIHTQAGKSQAEVDRMSKAVLSLAPATAQGPVELAKALYHIESVGSTGARALTQLKVASEGAAVGNANLEDTASALVGTMRVYHLAASQSAEMMGNLNAVIGAGNMRMDDMVNAIQTGLFPTAQGLGMSFREVGAALATMTDESVPAQVAATRMRTLFLLMSGETKKSVDTLKTLGIGQLELGHAMARPGGMINALLILREHLRKFSSDPALQTQFLAKAFGGARSSGTIIQLLNNLTMVQQKLGQINKTAGDYPAAVAATQATDAFKLHQAWSQLETTLIHIGAVVTPIFVTMAQGVARLTAAFSSLSPDTQRFVIELGLIAASVGPIIFAIGALTTGLAALATPMGLAVVAFTALSIVAAKTGELRALVGILGGAAVGFAAFTIAANGAAVAETLVLRGWYAMEAGMAANPIMAAAIALGALVGFLVMTTHNTDQEAAAFNRATGALYAYVNAVNAAKGAALGLKDAHLGVQQAHIAVQRAVQNLREVEGRAGHTHLDVKEAALGVRAAYIALAHAHDNLDKAQGKSEKTSDRLRAAHNKEAHIVSDLQKHFQNLQEHYKNSAGAAGHFATISERAEKRLHADAVKKYADGLDAVAVKADKVADANRKSNPQVARAAAALRDQALATAALTRKLHEIPDAVSKNAALAKSEAQRLGLGITSGVVAGSGGLGAALGASLAGQVAQAIAEAKRSAKIKSPSEVTRDQIGKPLGEGVVRGFLVGSRDLPDKMRDSLRNALEHAQSIIQEEQSKFTTAFGRLGDYAMRAFDAHTDKIISQHRAKLEAALKANSDALAAAEKELDKQHQAALDAIEAKRAELTPSEQALKSLQESHDEGSRQASIEDARDALRQAQTIGDPGQIKAAQRALDEALYQEQSAALQKNAEAERAAKDAQAKLDEQAENDKYDKQREALEAQFQAIADALQKQFDEWQKQYQAQRDLQKQHLQDFLDRMAADLEKHPEHWKKWHKKMMKLFKEEFGPGYSEAAANLGRAFAKGLREAFRDIEHTLKELAELIAKYLKLRSPAEMGPMADLDKWWSGFSDTLLSGLDTAAIERAADDLSGRMQVLQPRSDLSPSAALGNAPVSGGDTIVVNVHGSLIHENELIDKIQKMGIQKKSRNTQFGLG